MFGILTVGGPRPELTANWDFWLPAYVLLSILLILVFVRARVTVGTAVAGFVSGTLWAWVDNAIGVLPAAALAVLLAVVVGAVLRRVAPSGRRR